MFLPRANVMETAGMGSKPKLPSTVHDATVVLGDQCEFDSRAAYITEVNSLVLHRNH